ncbi:MAG: hypothetical protein ACOYN0_02670 [Phycisphaerales bacterium]
MNLLRNARKWLSTGVIAGVGYAALAGPLDPRLVPADAAWAAHLDMDAVTASQMGIYVRSSLPPEVRSSLKDFTAGFGIDPFVDVHSVTVFGLDREPKSGAAIVIASSAADDLPRRLTEAGLQSFTVETKDQVSRFSWFEHGKHWHAALSPFGEDSRAIVFADSTQDLDAGLAVVRAARSSTVTTGLSVSSESPRKGSLFFAAMKEMPVDETDAPRAQLLRAATSVTIDVGEAPAQGGPRLFARVFLQTGTPADAVAIRDMVQGLLAVSRLGLRADPQILKELDSAVGAIHMTAEGNTFRLEAEHPCADAVRMMKLIDAKTATGDASESRTAKEDQSERIVPAESPAQPR